jgi:hypothetical protein
MKIASGWSTNLDAAVAAEQAYQMVRKKLESVPHLLLVHSSSAYDNKRLIDSLAAIAPGVPIHGGTSCLGVMTEEGFHSEDGLGIGILGVFDPDGSYGVGAVDVTDDPKAAAWSALDQALAQAGRSGEAPVAVLVSSYPGQEELIINAIEEYLGSGVPIIGGTTADNDMSGQWQQFGNHTVLRQGVSIATLFPCGDIGYSFHSGYEPTEHQGRATMARGRTLYKIDDRPAAQVYNEWTEGLAKDVLAVGGSLVPRSTFSPVGNPVGHVGGIPYYRLSYPVEVLPDDALLLFTDVQEGSGISLMKGTPDSLLTRPARVAAAAIEAAPFAAEELQGALVFFCAGCMLAVKDRMKETLEGLRSGLNGTPFVCAFTLGEQGCFIGGENRHGNLMVMVLSFGPTSEG